MNEQPQNSATPLAGKSVTGLVPAAFTERFTKVVMSLGGTPSHFSSAEIENSQSNLSEFANRLVTGGIDVVLFHSCFGFQKILNTASRTLGRQRYLEALSDIQLVAANREVEQELSSLGLEATTPDPPGRWRQLLKLVDSKFTAANLSLAVEVFMESRELHAGLESRGVRVYPLNGLQTQIQVGSTDDVLSAIEDSEILYIDSPCEANWLIQNMDSDQTVHLNRQLRRRITLTGCCETEMILKSALRSNFVSMSSESPLDRPIWNEQLNQPRIKNLLRVIQLEENEPNMTAPWENSPFMKACRGEPTDVTPIWMMRQAGRYMAEYREVRDKVSFLELCANPQLCSEVMCTAVERLGVDAAIIFSDLLPILVPMGCDLEFVKGDGPVIHNPVRETSDIDRIKPLENMDELSFVTETVSQTRADLPDHLPLIGFAGAPFTLASYMVEGGASRNYENTKKLMFSDPEAWHELMSRLSDSIALYLNSQVTAGAQCLQLFDSWAGCLNYEDYRTRVLPYVQKIISSIPVHVPVINFATGNPALLPLLADTEASVVGIDWRIRLDDAWQTVGHDRAVQGNLDPTVLMTDPKFIRSAAEDILKQAGGRPGHIFNLGHGILPTTPVDNAIALVDAVHELSSK